MPFQTFRLQPPPCAPVLRRCSLFRAGLTPDSLCRAIGGSSDFAHYSQSRQSHQAVSSLCRGLFRPVSSTDYPFVSSCSPHRVAAMQLLSTRGGKHRHRGTSTPLCTLILKRTSATVPVAVFGVSPNTFRSAHLFTFSLFLVAFMWAGRHPAL